MTSKFDLSKMRFSEMSQNEMEEVNGGFWPVLFALAALATAAAESYDAGYALGAGLMDGWNRAVNSK
jgi:lactobin A/cerein 7B family class IIb bacteriocin